MLCKTALALTRATWQDGQSRRRHVRAASVPLMDTPVPQSPDQISSFTILRSLFTPIRFPSSSDLKKFADSIGLTVVEVKVLTVKSWEADKRLSMVMTFRSAEGLGEDMALIVGNCSNPHASLGPMSPMPGLRVNFSNIANLLYGTEVRLELLWATVVPAATVVPTATLRHDSHPMHDCATDHVSGWNGLEKIFPLVCQASRTTSRHVYWPAYHLLRVVKIAFARCPFNPSRTFLVQISGSWLQRRDGTDNAPRIPAISGEGTSHARCVVTSTGYTLSLG